MRFGTRSCIALLSLLACGPALHAARQKRIAVRQVSTVTMAEASALSASAQYQARPHAALKPLPPPLLTPPRGAKIQAAGPDNLAFAGFPVVGPDTPFAGWDGLDSTNSSNTNGLILEPPDQGLATNGADVFEAVNSAVQVFGQFGKPLTKPVSSYALFKVTASHPDGSFTYLSDPRVFYDWEVDRWFATVTEYTITAAGAFAPGGAVLVAVSTSGDPMGSYRVYSVDVSESGYPGCPCFGDQPLLGMNADGVFLETNEFATQGAGGFATALIVAINKGDLIGGSKNPTAVGFDGLTVAEGYGFSVQPALPTPGANTTANNGTEYFTSSLNFYGVGDNRIALWALTNTETLEGSSPNLNLMETVLPSEEYTYPVPAQQRAGSYPLGQSLGDAEEYLDTGDTRMHQMFYANGKLYCALPTSLFDPTGQSGPRGGGAWFEITPKTTLTTLSGAVTHQGYVGIKNGAVLYPAIAVNQYGVGVISLSYTGPNYFPSTGYVHIDNGSVSPWVHAAGFGQAPDDGFTGYSQFGGSGVARWGDYSAAMVTPAGYLYVAGEYIPNPFHDPRTPFTNWGTFIARVH